MADIIDFITTALADKQDKVKGNEFVEQLKAGSAEKLQAWFEEEGFKGISRDDCDKLIENKENVIHNSEVSLKSNY